MNRAQDLHNALEAAESALGGAVECYRLLLGCCASCGDTFELGELAVAMVDEKGHTCFEHELCPDESSDVRGIYREAARRATSKQAPVVE